MVDTLGYRMKFGVIAPSTNTSVEPEFAWMQPEGVTNHFSRIETPDMAAVEKVEAAEIIEQQRLKKIEVKAARRKRYKKNK